MLAAHVQPVVTVTQGWTTAGPSDQDGGGHVARAALAEADLAARYLRCILSRKVLVSASCSPSRSAQFGLSGCSTRRRRPRWPNAAGACVVPCSCVSCPLWSGWVGGCSPWPAASVVCGCLCVWGGQPNHMASVWMCNATACAFQYKSCEAHHLPLSVTAEQFTCHPNSQFPTHKFYFFERSNQSKRARGYSNSLQIFSYQQTDFSPTCHRFSLARSFFCRQLASSQTI